MELHYKPWGGKKADPCWRGRKDGRTVEYKRVGAGIALPRPEQPQGCVVVVGEMYRPDLPPMFEGLGARVGAWPALEEALGTLRESLHVADFITEDEEATELLQRVPGLQWGSEAVPVMILAASKQARGEVARQRVDQLIRDGRLRLEELRPTLDQAPETSAAAIQHLVAWLLENEASYYSRRRKKNDEGGAFGWMGR